MNKFSADFSSSINSTPGKQPTPQNQFFSSKPSQVPSTTPIAPPPSQIFGSSAFGTGVSKFNLGKTTNSPSPTGPHFLPPRTKNGTPQIHHSSQRASWSKQDLPSDDDMEEEDEEDAGESVMQPTRGFQSVNQPHVASLMKFSTNSARGSRISTQRRPFRASNRLSALPKKGNDNVLPNLAKDMGARAQPATITEPDEVILETEQCMRSLEQALQDLKDRNRELDTISDCATDLTRQWQHYAQIDRPSLDSADIGPPPSASPFSKANYVASLLLLLRHPPVDKASNPLPIPNVLLEWLDQYHVSYDPMYRTVASARPNCTSHDLYWDAILSLTLRGKLQQVMQLLADADFQYAASAEDDGNEGHGYKGAQLQAIQSVVYRARMMLNSCPAIQNGDWNVAGPEWDMFRASVEGALDSLTEETTRGEDNGLEAGNLDFRQNQSSFFGKLSRRSTSTIPWTIFQNLKILYSILLGSTEEIIAISQDWLEAATSLTIWWDGTADTTAVAQWSFDVSRANNQVAQDEDFNPYLGRLRDALLFSTDPESKRDFQLNSMSPVEVGLGCVLQGSTKGALTILRTLSQCVASAVAEVGSRTGWLEDETSARPSGLNDEDLMVLSYGAPKQALSKDAIMLSYANKLFEIPSLRLSDGTEAEGWEAAISLVTRLDDRQAMHNALSTWLDTLDVTTEHRAEKLIGLCDGMGLRDESRRISDRFGDYLVDNTERYGTALLCYAKSHNQGKIRQLIDVLVSYSLVQSRAYPSETTMDKSLADLVGDPKIAMQDIAEVDPEAAELLQFYLVGYACTRRFYTLRDSEVGGTGTNKSRDSRPLARRRAAAKALVAAIESAADSIYGGLYDPDRQTAIQVDGLLTLLGEATALLSPNPSAANSPRIFTTTQIYALLSAIEDLSTVSERVYAATEECLQASLQEYNGSKPPSPRDLLKKSMTSGSGSGFSYSVLGSEMLGRSQATLGSGSAGSSGVLVRKGQNVKQGDGETKGWDWRERFAKGDEDVNGKDIIRTLRLSLAEELAWAELAEGANAF
jgi:hypothetical protein